MKTKVQCPQCAGEGMVRSTARPGVDMACPTCDGSAKIDQEKADRIAAGNAMRSKRLALGLSPRDAAMMLGLTVTILTEMETGVRTPDISLYGDATQD